MVNKGGEDLFFKKGNQEIIHVSVFLRACPYSTTSLPGIKKAKAKQHWT